MQSREAGNHLVGNDPIGFPALPAQLIESGTDWIRMAAHLYSAPAVSILPFISRMDEA